MVVPLIPILYSGVGLGPITCAEKQRLISEFILAVVQYVWSQVGHLKSVVVGAPGFEAEINTARKRKEAAKTAILNHQTEHRC